MKNEAFYGTDMVGGGCANRTHECWLQRPEPYHLANPLYSVSETRLLSLQTHIRPAFRRKIMRA